MKASRRWLQLDENNEHSKNTTQELVRRQPQEKYNYNSKKFFPNMWNKFSVWQLQRSTNIIRLSLSTNHTLLSPNGNGEKEGLSRSRKRNRLGNPDDNVHCANSGGRKKIKVVWTQNIETKTQIVSRYFTQCFTKTDKTFSYEICFSPSSTETIQKIHIRLKTKVGRPSYLKESFAPDCALIYKYDQAITHDWSWQSYMIIATVAIHWAMRLGIAHGFGMLNCVFL